MDDSIAEHPHACARREVARARNLTFTWMASSQNIRQNCMTYDNLLAEVGADEQALWNAMPSGLFNESSPNTARRGGEKSDWYARVYDITSHNVFKGYDDFDWDAPLLPHDAVDPDLPELPLVRAGAESNDADVFDPVLPVDDQRMFAEYLIETIPRYAYFSVAVTDDGGEKVHYLYQVLSKECRDVLCETFLQEQLSKWTWQVQALEYFKDPEFRNLQRLPRLIDTFVVEQPKYVSIFELFGHSPEGRSAVQLFDYVNTDGPRMAATFTLSNARPLEWRHHGISTLSVPRDSLASTRACKSFFEGSVAPGGDYARSSKSNAAPCQARRISQRCSSVGAAGRSEGRWLEAGDTACSAHAGCTS